MTNACRACNKSISCNGLTCASCGQCFHGKCVFKAGANELSENAKKWKCGRCLKKTGVQQAPSVQVQARIVHAQASNDQILVPVQSQAPNAQVQKAKKIARASPNVNDIYSMFLELKKDLKSFQTGLVDSIKRLHDKIEANAKSFDEQNKKLSECFEIIRSLKKENEDLRNDIEIIKKRQTEADQKTRQNDLEIRGVPPQPNENVIGILQSLALALRSPLMIDGHCIVFCYRCVGFLKHFIHLGGSKPPVAVISFL